MRSRSALHQVVGLAIFLLPHFGCCHELPDPETPEELEGKLEGASLDAIRESEDDNDARCAQACERLASAVGLSIEQVLECTAKMFESDVSEPKDPWDPAHKTLSISCTIDPALPAKSCPH